MAERKIKTLLISGACTKVIAPAATRSIIDWTRKKKIVWRKRKYRTSDLKGIGLVIAATSDKAANACISRDAKKKGVLVNVVDQPRLSNFISPAVFYTAQALIAVSTNGRNPKLSRDLKNYLKKHWLNFLSYRKRLAQ